METTPRDVWHWLTTIAWYKLQMIRFSPLDAPRSYSAHVAVAGLVWLVAAVMALSLIWQTVDQLQRERDARQRERQKRKADSKDEYELAYWALDGERKGPATN
jgi:hypothetical protein